MVLREEQNVFKLCLYRRTSRFLGIVLFLSLFRTGQCELYPNSSAIDEGNRATQALYSVFYLALAAEDDSQLSSGAADKTGVVFKDGSVQKNWLPAAPGDNNASSLFLFHHDQFADRISFDFSFGSFGNYDIRKPKCYASHSMTAKPKVVDFQIDSEESSGSFSIVYDCHRLPDTAVLRNVTVSIVFPVVSGLSVFFSFRKTCGGGTHKFIEFGYFEESHTDTAEVQRIPFTSSNREHIVGPHQMSTKLYIHLREPALSQEFFHMTVNTSSDILTLTPRGPTFGGVLKSQELSVIHVLYECHRGGSVNVSIGIPIYPFKTLTASWRKDCGGGLAHGLNVGTSVSERNNVVAASKTVEIWLLALQTTSKMISGTAPTVNASIRYKEFWLSNDGITVHVASPVVTVEDPEILDVFSSNPNGKKYVEGEARNFVQRGSVYQLRLHMLCKKKGTSNVIVTFPIRSFSNIDFGFVKKCRAPKTYIHSGFLRTANSAMVALSFFMAAGFAYWWIPQYQALSTKRYKHPSSYRRRPPVSRVIQV